MSDERHGLALAFIQSHPAAAAQVLEQQDLEQVAEFLGDIPARHGRMILQQFLPQYAARVLGALATEPRARLVARLSASRLAAILRYAKPRARNAMLKNLPVKTRSACQLLLHYTDDAVGAWMRPAVATVPELASAGEALDRIKSQTSEGLSEPVLVVSRDRQVLGMLTVSRLLHEHPDDPVTQTMHQPPGQIRGRTTLYSARNHPGWRKHDVLVVVNQNKQLLGVLPHAALRKGLANMSADSERRGHQDQLATLLEVYGGSAMALVGSVATALHQSRPAGDST